MKFKGTFHLEHYRGPEFLGVHDARNNFTVEGIAALWKRIMRRATNSTYYGLIRGGESFGALDYDDDTLSVHDWEESDAWSLTSRLPLTSANFWSYASAEGTAYRENYSQYIKPITFNVERTDVLRAVFLTDAYEFEGTVWDDDTTPGVIYCEAEFAADIKVRDGDTLLLSYLLQGQSEGNEPTP